MNTAGCSWPFRMRTTGLKQGNLGASRRAARAAGSGCVPDRGAGNLASKNASDFGKDLIG